MAVFYIEAPQYGEVAMKQAGLDISMPARPNDAVGRTLREHFAGVMNAVISGITNATSEAINARIQWLKQKAKGFRSRERFRMAIYFHLGRLQLYPGAATNPPHFPEAPAEHYGADAEAMQAYLQQGSRAVGLAINARRQRFPDETPYRHQPFEPLGPEHRWSPAVMQELKDYNLKDLSS